MFEAVIGAAARARPHGLKHGAHALGEVPGVHGVRLSMSRDGAAEEVWSATSFWPTLVRTSPRSMTSLSNFELVHRVNRRRREVGFVAVPRGHREKHSCLFTCLFGSFAGEIGGSAEFVARICILLKWVSGRVSGFRARTFRLGMVPRIVSGGRRLVDIEVGGRPRGSEAQSRRAGAYTGREARDLRKGLQSAQRRSLRIQMFKFTVCVRSLAGGVRLVTGAGNW